MQVLKDERNLRAVEPGLIIIEPSRLPQMREELTTDHVLEHEV